jgi:hypothetical protein
MDLRFSEFTRKKDTLLEFFSIMESCLSRGMTIDSFTRLAVKPVFESLNFTSEQEFINQIRRKVSLFNEDAVPAPAQAAGATPAPATGAKPAVDFEKEYGGFLKQSKESMKNAIQKQLQTMLTNMENTVDKTYKNKNQNIIAKTVGKNIINALSKALTTYDPKVNFSATAKQAAAAPAAGATPAAGQQQAAQASAPAPVAPQA